MTINNTDFQHTQERNADSYNNKFSERNNNMSNTDLGSSLKKNWAEIKKKIEHKWDKIKDVDLEDVKENMESLSHKVQKNYGWAKERAEQEVKDFKASISSLLHEQADKIDRSK